MKSNKKGGGKLENRADHVNTTRNLQGSNQGHDHIGNKNNREALGNHTGDFGSTNSNNISEKPKMTKKQ